MKRIFPLSVLIVVLAFSALACRMSPLPDLGQDNDPTPLPPAVQVPMIPQVPVDGSVPDLAEQETLLVGLYERVNPGVVAIEIATEAGGASGTGFVYDQLGHIITNFHVVEGATDLEVDFPSGLKVRGEVVGTDPDSDIAVVKVDVDSQYLVPLPLGSGEDVRIGQTVVAIGNPFGLTGTMTTGIVSAKGRTLDSMRSTPDGGVFSAGAVIQTDAAINPGNSGGPLLNLNGEVVGINRAIATESSTALGEPANSGVGFAVNVDIVKRVVPELIRTGKYDYPYLGVTSREDISLLEQESLGLPQSTGAYIISVRPNSPAEEAGLRGGSTDSGITGLPAGGDLIIAIDGQPVKVFGDLLTYLMVNKGPGDQVVMTILRDGEQKEVTVTLAKRP